MNTTVKSIPAGTSNTVPVDGPGNYVGYENPGTLVNSAYNGLYPTLDVGFDHPNQMEGCISPSIMY